MKPRLDPMRAAPDGYKAMVGLEKYIHASGLDEGLIHIVKLRASQINGCAYCIDMHAKDARAAGETEQRLYALSAWRETGFFTARERAAFALTEAITLVADSHVPPTVLDEAAMQFPPEELSKVVFAVIEINAWNRLVIATGAPEPGSYEPPAP
jgi:AhpD family alkylhydroperoxidase